MGVFLELFGLDSFDTVTKNRLVMVGFCLLIASILTYFWYISRAKIKAAGQDGKGLVYLSFSFLLYACIGLVSIYKPGALSTLLILSGLISCCFLSALSYFSLRAHWLDRLVSQPAWKNSVKYFAFGWVIVISLLPDHPVTKIIDAVLAVVSLAALGFFLTRYFRRRQLNFIAVITGGYFLVFVALQVLEPDALAGGKFTHINTVFLAPALALSVIALAYTFNWINELNFYELSSIWTGQDAATGVETTKATAIPASSAKLQRGQWVEMLAKDDLERVIQEVIIAKKHRNETLEEILNVASRNTRNNNNQLKGIIKYEDYQLNRNQLGEALLVLLRK